MAVLLSDISRKEVVIINLFDLDLVLPVNVILRAQKLNRDCLASSIAYDGKPGNFLYVFLK